MHGDHLTPALSSPHIPQAPESVSLSLPINSLEQEYINFQLYYLTVCVPYLKSHTPLYQHSLSETQVWFVTQADLSQTAGCNVTWYIPLGKLFGNVF